MDVLSPRRITRSARKIAPNRLQRLPDGSFKRKFDLVALIRQPSKRRRRSVSSVVTDFEEVCEKVESCAACEVPSSSKEGKNEVTSTRFTIKADESRDFEFPPFSLALSSDSDSEDLNPSQQTENFGCLPQDVDGRDDYPKEDKETPVDEKISAMKPREEPVSAASPGYDAERSCRKSGYAENGCCYASRFKWLKSGRRFAAILKSAGLDEVPSAFVSSPVDGKGFEKAKSSVEPNITVRTPVSARAELANIPGKRKVALSPRSQLKLLEASNKSTYKRLMPFFAELAKDLHDSDDADAQRGKEVIPISNSKESNIHVSAKKEILSTGLSDADLVQGGVKRLISMDATLCKEQPRTLPDQSQAEKPVRKCYVSETILADNLDNEEIKSLSKTSSSLKSEADKNLSRLSPLKDSQSMKPLPEEHGNQQTKKYQSDSSCIIKYQKTENSTGFIDNVVERKKTEQCVSSIRAADQPTQNENLFRREDISPLVSLERSTNCFCHPLVGSSTPSKPHTPASVPSKGILKLSPRTCKGLCHCTDCVYFRTNAEKSADFVERQLHEVEALVMPLINEVATFRTLIQNSMSTKEEGSQTISQSKVKEASKSASKVEGASRDALKKISRDINLHCKIMRMQQRTVKFAEKNQVKLF